MMETMRIKTLVRSDHKLGNDSFILGRIMGAMAVMCKEDPANGIEHGRGRCEHGHIFVAETRKDKYDAFTKVIESWYPGLCIFYYVE